MLITTLVGTVPVKPLYKYGQKYSNFGMEQDIHQPITDYDLTISVTGYPVKLFNNWNIFGDGYVPYYANGSYNFRIHPLQFEEAIGFVSLSGGFYTKSPFTYAYESANLYRLDDSFVSPSLSDRIGDTHFPTMFFMGSFHEHLQDNFENGTMGEFSFYPTHSPFLNAVDENAISNFLKAR